MSQDLGLRSALAAVCVAGGVAVAQRRSRVSRRFRDEANGIRAVALGFCFKMFRFQGPRR